MWLACSVLLPQAFAQLLPDLYPSMPLRDGTGPDQPFLIHPKAGVPPPPAFVGLGAILDAYQHTQTLGTECTSNESCASRVPNTGCTNNTCLCLDNFYPDPHYPDACRLAPGYDEPCALGDVCRAPFTCNTSAICDCPPGTIQEFFQCVPDCPVGKVPVGANCYKGAELGEECLVSEQCVQSYASCRHGRCQCIAGANQVDKACQPVSKCPLGEVGRDATGEVARCDGANGTTESCPADHYCLHPEAAEAGASGFCCPRVQLNCPIGHPLPGVNCSACPWDTHHCFSFAIGAYAETMCCPNACSASQPIQKDGKCYARVAFGGNCEVNEQCYNVVGSQCREEDSVKKCRCPAGNYRNHFGRCVRVSKVGEECGLEAECEAGGNAMCVDGRCQCYPGFVPRPDKPNLCIAEPTCPTSGGVSVMSDSYTDCSSRYDACAEGEYCRTWWYDLDNTTFALCCPKPSREDYEGICGPVGLELLVGVGTREPPGNMLADEVADFPVPCDLIPAPIAFHLRDAPLPRAEPVRLCPPGSTCVFDPFSVNRGVCCATPATPTHFPQEESEVSRLQMQMSQLQTIAHTERTERFNGLPDKKPAEIIA